MKILLNNNDLNKALIEVKDLGFVPTMGSLHNGHVSLIKKSIINCNKTLVSIFVNPTQFNDRKDFKKYPRNKNKDLSLLRKLDVDFVYMPKISHIYNSKKKNIFKLKKKDKILCGKFRKGHFEGVINVMDRLTQLIKPNKIYMGEKDYQQIHLIKKYINKKYRNKIITCKTIRDKNQLALSSRNKLLKEKDILLAGKLIKNLKNFKKKLSKKMNIKKTFSNKIENLEKLFKVKIEYLELRTKSLTMTKNITNSKLFIAFYINKVRLIDNF